MDVACVLDAKALLGEAPIWDVAERSLYWVDITGRRLHRFDPATGANVSWPTPEEIGCVALCEDGNLLVALKRGIYIFDPQSAVFQHIVSPEASLCENRFNDGKPDRQGRFWVGSMHEPKCEATGALYRLDSDLTYHRVVEGIICSNSLCWSPDSRILYYGDSARRTVWMWDFEAEIGTLSNRRIFVEFGLGEGEPDGATVDCEGHVWIAIWDGWRVVRYDSTGRLERTVHLPVRRPTCPAFGGADLDMLYITSARIGLSKAEAEAQKAAGGVLACRPGVKGIPERRFAAMRRSPSDQQK